MKTASNALGNDGLTPAATPSRYRAGDLIIDLVRDRVTRDGEEIPLPRLSFLLLKALVLSAPDFVSVPRLMEQVWPRLVVGADTVSQRVKLLRTALGDEGEQRRYVEAGRGRGYRLAVAVEPLPVEDVGRKPSGVPRARRKLLLVACAFAALAVSATSIWRLAFPHSGGTAPSALAPSSHLRLAVLPLQNLSPAPDQAFFADGLHDEILTSIANSLPDLEVISRTTMTSYRNRRTTVRQLAQETGCTHVLEGAVRREGDEVRLTLQLIDATTDRRVWSQSYARKLVRSVVLQSEIARQVAQQLSVRLAAASEAMYAHTIDPVAYDSYLKARLAYQQFNTGAKREQYAVARQLVDEAIARDANFGPSHLLRAAIIVLTATTFDPQHALMPALAAARKDIEWSQRLMGDDPSVLATSAWVSYLEDGMDAQPRAAREWERARAGGLREPQMLTAGAAMLSDVDRLVEALPILEQQAALDPENPQTLTSYQQALDGARRPADSMRVIGLMSDKLHMPIAPLLRGRVIFDYTGRTDALRAALESPAGDLAPEARLGALWGTLLLEHRYREAAQLLDGTPTIEFRFHVLLHGASIDVARGWTHLLSGNAGAAADIGHRLIDAAANPSPHESGTYRQLDELQSLSNLQQGYLFAGRKSEAVALARKSLQLAQSMTWHPARTATAAVASMVFAWAGAENEAVDLLERLSLEAGGLSPNEYPLTPGNIAHNPIYTVPMANNPRFQALRQRLEAEMSSVTASGVFNTNRSLPPSARNSSSFHVTNVWRG